jgi:class 3 adenylate cyclase
VTLALNTPKHLSEKILTSRSALEGERKQVIVLFADVKGSMDLSEQLDPEEWHKIMERFFAILGEGVRRFEGTINQYTGGGIMALFGAPIAHEDHAQRACYGALHLQQELRRYADAIRLEHGLGFSVRMGINSGEVVVGKIGDDLRMDYTAQGRESRARQILSRVRRTPRRPLLRLWCRAAWKSQVLPGVRQAHRHDSARLGGQSPQLYSEASRREDPHLAKGAGR